MKKGIKILTIIVLCLAVSVPFSCKNRVNHEDATGTIGKAKKYRKDQMSEKDIELRSEFIEDSAKLASLVKGLIAFNAYAKTISESIDEQIKQLKSTAYSEIDAHGIVALEDYSEFLKNNQEMLENTLLMFVDFYNDDVSEVSFDVEQNLRNFANFVNQLNDKNVVLDESVDRMDDYIAQNIDLEEKTEEVENIKNIRDEIMLRNIQSSFFLNDQDKINSYVASKSMYNVDKLNFVVGAIEDLNSQVASMEGLNNAPGLLGDQTFAPAAVEILNAIPGAMENLNSFQESGELNHFVAAISGELNSLPIILDKEFFNVVISLQQVPSIEGIEGLNAVNPVMAVDDLNVYVPAMDNLNVYVPAIESINSAINDINSFSNDLNMNESLNIIRPS